MKSVTNVTVVGLKHVDGLGPSGKDKLDVELKAWNTIHSMRVPAFAAKSYPIGRAFKVTIESVGKK